MNSLVTLQDTRSAETTNLESAIQSSQPDSGGLWLLTSFPLISKGEIKDMANEDYIGVARAVLRRFFSDDILDQTLPDAYGTQWHNPEITPLKHIVGNLHSLHLGYGPTFAFKNVALELLPRLLAALAGDKVINVLGASSGDTINAAHSGVNGTNIRSLFMLPSKGPSAIQQLQAVNGIVSNPNAITLLADASFDPLQDIVKRIISTEEFAEFKAKHNITSFNSINIARILAQVVYTFRAESKLIKNGVINLGDEWIASVPSGNFGDALSVYWAKKMGAHVKKIVVATNENDMLHKFIQTGRYEPPKKNGKDFVEVTNAPSMDIAKSSNFERMLFDMVDGDVDRVRGWYEDLAKNGYFQVDPETLRRIQEVFISTTSTNVQREAVISKFGKDYNHGIDPHTAAAVVPWVVAKESNDYASILTDDNIPVVFFETSHVAQFGQELEQNGIIVPGMHEFDATLDIMRKAQPIEGVHYLRTGHSFETIMPDIKRAIEEILPARFSK